MNVPVASEIPSRRAMVIDALAAVWDVPREAILASTRYSRAASEARAAGYFLFRASGLSWSEVGRVFGRDHSTAFYGATKIYEAMSEDPALAERVRLAAQLGGVLAGQDKHRRTGKTELDKDAQRFGRVLQEGNRE